MHPLRSALHNELHARPSLYFNGPAHVFHFAFLGNPVDCAKVLHACGVEVNCTEQTHGIRERDGYAFKWEQHSEFFTLTLVAPCNSDESGWRQVPPVLAKAIAPHCAQIINAIQIAVRNEQHLDTKLYGFKDPCGSCVGGGDAAVWSDFRLSADGANHFLFVNYRLNAYRQGRMIRRLLEIETYRMMASLSLHTAKKLSRELDEFDKVLVNLSERSAQSNGGDSKGLLDAIAHLSRQVVSRTVTTRHRFGATQAYAQLVFERLGELRESHVGDCQRLGIFIERRFKPTIRYCAATEQRLEQMAKNVANLGDLLQARVQVEMEEQNAEILRGLNARADAQVKIQRAVEGLSIIAIAYYLLNLFKLFYSGLNVLGVHFTAREAIVTMAPFVIGLLGLILVRIAKAKRH
ncbi:DUF3422 domain-containing protein [Pseudomonas sp. BP8]|uniref:DUF3422 domain-containing protein n=1 Tax=Pseudomonas sp. BP8 TaxID=2817864 RepID=UPI001AE4E75E|nr:DUF3422 domain-containing protein [Pseudomonas sp. BP8]MBP2261564.1 putative membrane-anchored protein [Pseudomonas sp. BP8]HDS1733473.1 DUF3422 domain-containing protein [Pseudomonas putida]